MNVEPSARDRAMSLLDEVCRRILARPGPITWGFAASEAEREAVYRLRGHVVLERGWRSPEEFPDGRERDQYDDAALHAVGLRDGEPVATTRLVFPHPHRLLPTEEAFDLVVRPEGEVVDMGRVIVARDVGQARRAVLWQLLSLLWLELRHRGFSRVCGANTTPAIHLYEAMGFAVTTLGPAREHWGELRFPILVDVGDTADTVADRASAFIEPGMTSHHRARVTTNPAHMYQTAARTPPATPARTIRADDSRS
jgi:N-acyl-L-homoserine lactone synthetase